jgi:hypothetical protein
MVCILWEICYYLPLNSELGLKKTFINNLLITIVVLNLFFALQNHFLPSLNHFFPVLKYIALSSWGLKHLFLFQPFTFTLVHYTNILDINYLTTLLFYIYILKKCGDHFTEHAKQRLFIPLYLLPTAVSALLYHYFFNTTLTPIFAPYLSLTSIVLSCAIISPNKKILKPVHARPAHYGIPLKWASLTFIAYHLSLGSLSSAPYIYLGLINIATTYLLASLTLKASSKSFFLSKIESLLHKDISIRETKRCARIDRILDKIATKGMKSLSYLDKLYLRINKSHIS